MTNVIGPRHPIYFAGRKVATAMFWVPQSGRMGMGISIFSYDSNVVVGIATDAGLVPDPEAIAQAFEDEFRSIQDWAGTSRYPLLAAAEEPPAATKPVVKKAVRKAARKSAKKPLKKAASSRKS
jgi:hypothetical protein